MLLSRSESARSCPGRTGVRIVNPDWRTSDLRLRWGWTGGDVHEQPVGELALVDHAALATGRPTQAVAAQQCRDQLGELDEIDVQAETRVHAVPKVQIRGRSAVVPEGVRVVEDGAI